MPTTPACSRRRAVRFALGAGLAVVPLLRRAGHAGAYRGWCRYDPTVRIDGAVVRLWVSGLADERYDVVGPTRIVFRLPPGVVGEVLEQDAGFGEGYAIGFAGDDRLAATATKLRIAADVYVPTRRAGRDQPILVEWIPDGTVKRADRRQGKTNEWIVAATKIKRGG